MDAALIILSPPQFVQAAVVLLIPFTLQAAARLLSYKDNELVGSQCSYSYL